MILPKGFKYPTAIIAGDQIHKVIWDIKILIIRYDELPKTNTRVQLFWKQLMIWLKLQKVNNADKRTYILSIMASEWHFC